MWDQSQEMLRLENPSGDSLPRCCLALLVPSCSVFVQFLFFVVVVVVVLVVVIAEFCCCCWNLLNAPLVPEWLKDPPVSNCKNWSSFPPFEVSIGFSWLKLVRFPALLAIAACAAVVICLLPAKAEQNGVPGGLPVVDAFLSKRLTRRPNISKHDTQLSDIFQHISDFIIYIYIIL